MRRLVSCHNLAGIGEDGGGEQAEGIDTWVGDEGAECLVRWGQFEVKAIKNK